MSAAAAGRGRSGSCDGLSGPFALELAAACNQDGDFGAVVLVYWDVGDGLEEILAGDDAPEDGVFAIQVGCGF